MNPFLPYISILLQLCLWQCSYSEDTSLKKYVYPHLCTECNIPCCVNSKCENATWYLKKEGEWKTLSYKGGNLIFNSVKRRDQGDYKCQYYANSTLKTQETQLVVEFEPDCNFNPQPNNIDYSVKSRPHPQITIECSITMTSDDDCDPPCRLSIAYWYRGDLREKINQCPNTTNRIKYLVIPDTPGENVLIDPDENENEKFSYFVRRVSDELATSLLIIDNPSIDDYIDYQCGTKTVNNLISCSDVLQVNEKDPDYSTVIISSVLGTLGFIICSGCFIFYHRYKIIIFRNKYLLRNYQSEIKENAFFILYERDSEDPSPELVKISQECQMNLSTQWGVTATYYDSDFKGHKRNQDKAVLINNCYVVLVLLTREYLERTDLLRADWNLCNYNPVAGWPKIIFLLVDVKKKEFNIEQKEFDLEQKEFDIKKKEFDKEKKDFGPKEFRDFILKNENIDVYEFIKKRTVTFFSLKNVSKWPFTTQFCNFNFNSRNSYDWLVSYLPGQAFTVKEKQPLPNSSISRDTSSIQFENPKTSTIFPRSISKEPII